MTDLYEATSPPDELFDADAAAKAAAEDNTGMRLEWIIEDGAPVFAPIIGWMWSCPTCGASGPFTDMSDDATVPPHGMEHVTGRGDETIALRAYPLRFYPSPEMLDPTPEGAQ